MMMSLSSICQTGLTQPNKKKYPAKVIIGKDTVVAITFQQLDSINGTKVKLNGCTELRDSLISKTNLQDKEIEGLNSVISLLEDDVVLADSIITIKDTLITLEQKKVKEKEKIIKKQKVVNKIWKGVTAGLAAIVIFLIVT